MRRQGRCAIVNCSSIGGTPGRPGRAACSASKHAIIGLTKSAAREYGLIGIRVNAVLRGTIDTPLVTEMLAAGVLDQRSLRRRSADPDEITAVLWLCGSDASFRRWCVPVDSGHLA